MRRPRIAGYVQYNIPIWDVNIGLMENRSQWRDDSASLLLRWRLASLNLSFDIWRFVRDRIQPKWNVDRRWQ
ncbi:hypothetical protein [Candidatus Villigracilis affinis]|uniref:hypothetical protein n=1 Tax=Candidatus Villigracilis affinis TaxID=3140682 RepID=UPI001D667A1F|nr:hypothetical protein [Anaerolineales bacterium]